MSTVWTTTPSGREYRLFKVRGHPFYVWKDGQITDENSKLVKGERLDNLRALLAPSLDHEGSQHGSRAEEPPARTPRFSPKPEQAIGSISTSSGHQDPQVATNYALFPRGDPRVSRTSVRSQEALEERPALSRDRHGNPVDATSPSPLQVVSHRSKDSGKWQTKDRDFAAADFDPGAKPSGSGSRHERGARGSVDNVAVASDNLASLAVEDPPECQPGSVRQTPAPLLRQDSNRPRHTNTALQPVPESTRISYAGKEDKLDSRYKVRNSKWFSFGRVLAVLWHENDSRSSHRSDWSEPTPFVGKHGESVYSTIRRFIIVKECDGYCTCIPILTYRKQGVMKPGLPANEIKKHSVVHMVGSDPDANAAEEARGMSKRPIAVKPASDDQKLHPMSRLNFGKVYTIDHQWKVMNVGKVHEQYLPRLESYFYDTFNEGSRRR